MFQFQFIPIFLCLSFIFGCAQGSKVNTNAVPGGDGIPQSKELLEVLVKAGVKPVPRAQLSQISVFDLECLVSLKGKTTCTYYEKKAEFRDRHKHVVTGELAEEIFATLVTFPVAQGETGAQTPYVICVRYENKADTSCKVGVDMSGSN